MTLVTSATACEPTDDLPFENGLIRSLVVGGLAGFALVFAMVCGGLLLAGIDPVASLLSAGFVGAFGGIGFGAMEGAAIHKPSAAEIAIVPPTARPAPSPPEEP